MAIITLTTDFGLKDHFVGAIKGTIYRELPNVNIVDISHLISPFNLHEAAYIIKNAYKSFPAGSVHIIGVDSELNPENKHIAVKVDNHYFIGADNGIISLIAHEYNPEQIVEINIHDYIETIFPVLDVFVKVACHIIRGGSLDVVGKPLLEIKQIKGLSPIIYQDKNQIVGNVIYIDNYGNVVTNITRKIINTHFKSRSFELYARNYRFKKIHDRYSDFINFNIEKHKRNIDGEKMAVYNSSGFVELAVYKSNLQTVGGASTLLGLNYRDTITINFE
ncbi:S-adenosyl-l-methionine hydroxide adenosyltransferase family protein [Zhouia sp. PK063]|uniref:S-adenosyl-l-methionine hydroxide adenosyltransferase family protein n=1 Tax=Zhouia sp. PK063 TaxID=3373602 RepID=UPI0037A8C6AC